MKIEEEYLIYLGARVVKGQAPQVVRRCLTVGVCT